MCIFQQSLSTIAGVIMETFDPDSAYKFMGALVKEIGNRDPATGSRVGGATYLMHTDLENLHWCGPEALAPVGKLCQTLLTRLANAGEFLFEKDIPSKIAKALEKRFREAGIKKKKKMKT